MGVLSGLEPKQVFRYFEELCAIPHGSHNTKAVSDYLKDFAEAHRLKFRRDELNNVIIWKAPTAGYEHSPAVMRLRGWTCSWRGTWWALAAPPWAATTASPWP